MTDPRKLPIAEFVAMMAVIFATIAFSTDAMLPAFPGIADELSPDTPNRVQLLVSSFMLGLGVGTLVTGPLADAFGRKPVVIGGMAIYAVAAVAAWAAGSLEAVLAARVVQGLGAAGPRIAPMAMIRDLYSGRKMAQILSFVMTVFMLVPAAAPLFGAGIIGLAGWRAIFLSFVVFALVASLWLGLRQPETLPPAARLPFRAGAIWAGVREVFAHSAVRLYLAALTLGFGLIVQMLSSTQPVYDGAFGRGASFPFWFGLTALMAASGTLLNASLVMRIGMRRLVIVAFASEAVLSAVYGAAMASGTLPAGIGFATWFLWSFSVFFMTGLTLGNLNSLALQPLGHIAGTAASVISAVSTVLAVLIAVPVGLAFDGTPLPLVAGVGISCALGWLIMRRTTEPLPGAVTPN